MKHFANIKPHEGEQQQNNFRPEHVDALLKRTGFNRQIGLQQRRLFQMAAQNLKLDDSAAMEIADIYPVWEPKQVYVPGTILKHGINTDGETQLWRVVQAHTSQTDWKPDTAPSLFSKIGFTQTGIPVWTQPTGAHDAYQRGDIVEHNGQQWESTADGNVWEPGVYGWTKKETAT